MYNPYEILGIEKDADKKTIKHAYAKLVKQYHPEEQPEEWKRIHDAYELAIKIASGQQQKTAVPVLTESQKQEQELALTNMVKNVEQKETPSAPAGTPEWKEAPSTPLGTPEQEEAPNEPTGMSKQDLARPIYMPNPVLSTPIETPKVQETEPENLFGDVEELANMQRQEEEKTEEEKLKSLMYEVWQLTRENKFKIEEWRKFFEQEDLLPVISQKKFLRELGNDFNLKQIDEDLYKYLDEQLNVISEYIKVHSTDSAGSGNIASVEFARSKVKAAYRYRLAVKEESRTRIAKWVVFIAAATIFVVVLSSLNQEEQRKAEEVQRQETMMEWQHELMKQQQEESQKQAQERLEADPEMKEEMIQRMKKDLKSGEITQEYYDFFFEYYGIDPDEAEE